MTDFNFQFSILNYNNCVSITAEGGNNLQDLQDFARFASRFFKTGITRNWPGISRNIFFKQQLPAIGQQLSAIRSRCERYNLQDLYISRGGTPSRRKKIKSTRSTRSRSLREQEKNNLQDLQDFARFASRRKRKSSRSTRSRSPASRQKFGQHH